MDDKILSAIKKPQSITSPFINFLSILPFCTVFFITVFWKNSLFTTLSYWLLSLAVPLVFVEIFYNQSLLCRTASKQESLDERVKRLSYKLGGLLGIVSCIFFIYWVFPWYIHDYARPILEAVEVFNSYFGVLGFLSIGLTGLAYIAFTDHRQDDPYDGLWMSGRFFTGNWHFIKDDMLKEYYKGWIVKAFFFPLMFHWLFNNAKWVNNYFPSWELRYFFEDGIPIEQAFPLFYLLQTFLFTLDLGLAVLGYVCTLKLLNTHVRSSQDTAFGWLACLLCYPPLFSMLDKGFLMYEDAITFETVFASVFWLKCLWGAMILGLLGIYTFATVQFGLRFSNLTHRGIITNGLYSLTKHPAYVSKNIAWWLISLPFITEGSTSEAVRHCFHLLMINGLYIWRAKTEEAHLSNDPDYANYKEWMNHNSIIAGIKKSVTSLFKQV